MIEGVEKDVDSGLRIEDVAGGELGCSCKRKRDQAAALVVDASAGIARDAVDAFNALGCAIGEVLCNVQFNRRRERRVGNRSDENSGHGYFLGQSWD